jgi:hypothetical protein
MKGLAYTLEKWKTGPSWNSLFMHAGLQPFGKQQHNKSRYQA